ncbi:MAG: hypothetical protein LBV61_08925 [Burkholderiaceae bacterium]|nr:hypothetical protein [Burkholderiaceae bacterium]
MKPLNGIRQIGMACMAVICSAMALGLLGACTTPGATAAGSSGGRSGVTVFGTVDTGISHTQTQRRGR